MSNIHRDQDEVATVEERRDGSYPSPTTRHEIEVILARQLAGYLALPTVIADPSLTVIYYNEPGERVLGRRFDEGGAIPWAEWTKAFEFTDEAGEPIPVEETPLPAALLHRRLSYLEFWMRGLDGARRHMRGTGVPLVGNAGRFLGAVAFFAEIEQ
jgi:PAS domain-containing protein